MDDTDTNQAASTSSSPEDILRQFGYLADVSPAFFPGVRVRQTPPVSHKEEEEETKRESPEPETETPIRRIRFSTPLREDPPSPLPPFEEPEPPTMAGAPTRDEFDRLVLQLDALNRTITAMAAIAPPRASSSVIADPNDFQRSPYAQPAPFILQQD